MATKAEVERMARRIWHQVLRPAGATAGISTRDALFESLRAPEQEVVRCLARWHLRKVKAAEKVADGAGYSKGYWAGRKVSNGKED